MKKLLLGLAFAAAITVPVSSVLAADLESPPPIYPWTGPYLGVFGTAVSIDGHYDAQQFCACPGVDPEMSGIGYAGGVLAGFNWQMDSLVFGLEGDWAFGGEVASNDDPAEATQLKFKDVATLRGRVGWAEDSTLLYVTGGGAAVYTEFGGLVGSISEDVSDAKWIYGWTAGAGIEQAITDNFHLRLEYLYVGLPDTDYTLINSIGEGGTVDQKFNNVQMVRAGVSYNFSW